MGGEMTKKKSKYVTMKDFIYMHELQWYFNICIVIILILILYTGKNPVDEGHWECDGEEIYPGEFLGKERWISDNDIIKEKNKICYFQNNVESNIKDFNCFNQVVVCEKEVWVKNNE